MRRLVVGVLSVAGLVGGLLVLASGPVAAERKIITIWTDSNAGTYVASWGTRNNCDPGAGTSGASGSVTLTVRDGTPADGEGSRVKTEIVIDDACTYDWSASFVTAAGVTCRITARSLQVIKYDLILEVESSCPTTASTQVPGEVTGVTYVVEDRTNGAGRVVWDAEPGATSYDFRLVLSLEALDDGFMHETEISLTDRPCCAARYTPGSGWRLRGILMSVRAVNSAGAGRWSRGVIAGVTYPSPRPGAVTGLRFDRDSSRILWQPASDAEAYDVQWRQPGERTVSQSVLCSPSDDSRVGSQCALRITRTKHQELDFRVRGKNNIGTNFGPWAGWLTDPAEAAEPVPPPGPVEGLAFSNGRISWLPTAGATAYRVEWRNAGESTTHQTVHCSSSRSCSLGITRAPDRELQFRVRAVNDGGSGPWSRWESRSSELNVPPPVTGMNYSDGRIVWNAIPGVTLYDVEWRHAGETTMSRTVNCSSSCSLAINRLRHKELQFRVRGSNADGKGAWPSTWQRRQPEVRAPGAVTGVQYQSGRAVWRAASNASSYQMQMDGRGGARTLAGLACCRSAVAENVSRFRIRAWNENLAGPWSSWAAVPSGSRPARVTGISYLNGRAVWQRQSTAASYDVAWSYAGESQTVVRSHPCCNYPIPNRTGKAIRVNIRAVNRTGAGPWSGWQTVWTSDIKLPGKVTGLHHVSHQSLAKWDSLPGVTRYRVAYRGAGEGGDSPVTCTSRCEKRIPQHQTLAKEFRVRAVNAAGNGPWSDWYRIRPYSEVPSSSPVITSLSHHSNFWPGDDEDVTVYWGTVSWATRYTVKWRYRDFTGDISQSVTSDGARAVESVRKWMDNDRNFTVFGSGERDVGNATSYRVKDVAGNSNDENFALEFQVVARNDSGASRESSWVSLASSQLRDEFSSNRCQEVELASDVWTVISIIGALYTGGVAAAVVGWVKPGATGTVLSATRMIEGCDETMTDALRNASPLFRVVLRITGIGNVLGQRECVYANLEYVTTEGDSLDRYLEKIDEC